MTSKEKAKELIDKYINLTEECDCLEYMCVCFRIPEYKAKECALITVDEILKVALFYNDSQAEIPYLEEVKQEIKNK